MKVIKTLSFLLIALFMSCRGNKLKENAIPADWIRLSLPNRWTIYTPPGFATKIGNGIDSQPGYIYSKKDSIMLVYDSGKELVKRKDCDLTSNFFKAKSSIDTGFTQTFYKMPLEHTAYIDTIAGRIAIVVKPTISGKGTTGIELYADCKYRTWLGIEATNLTAKRQELVLQIYKTLREEE